MLGPSGPLSLLLGRNCWRDFLDGELDLGNPNFGIVNRGVRSNNMHDEPNPDNMFQEGRIGEKSLSYGRNVLTIKTNLQPELTDLVELGSELEASMPESPATLHPTRKCARLACRSHLNPLDRAKDRRAQLREAVDTELATKLCNLKRGSAKAATHGSPRTRAYCKTKENSARCGVFLNDAEVRSFWDFLNTHTWTRLCVGICCL